MKRRNFIASSGGVIMVSLDSIERPTIAVSLTLNDIDNKNPQEIDSMSTEFSKLEIVPKYINSEKNITVSATLEVTDGTKSWTDTDSADISSYKNNRAKTVSSKVRPVVENIDTTDSVLDGEVVVEVDHSDLSKQTYRQSFSISKQSVLSDPYIRVEESLTSYEQDALSNTGAIEELLETHVGPKGNIETSSGDTVKAIKRYENGELKGTSTVQYTS